MLSPDVNIKAFGGGGDLFYTKAFVTVCYEKHNGKERCFKGSGHYW